MTLDQNEIINVLAQALQAVAKGTSNEGTVDEGKYINRTAAVMLMKYAEEDVESLRYANGEPIEKAYIDDLRTMLGNFNRSEYVTGQKAEIVLNAVLNSSEFFNNFTVKYGNELTIPIDLIAYAKRQLTSTERLGRQLTASEQSALASISGYDMFCLPVELQYDITMTEIRNHLYDPKFEQKVLIEPMTKVLAEDLLDLATNGTSDAYTTASSTGFLALGIGHEYLLANANGTNTNTNGTVIITGKFGKYHTPNRIKLPFTASSYTGFDLIAAMDRMWRLMDSQYRSRPDVAWVMSQYDADLYAEAKGAQVVAGTFEKIGINTVNRDDIKNYGLIPPHHGKPIKINPKKVSVAEGGNFYLGALKELYVGAQKKIETTREYKARMSRGGSGIENTKILYTDFQIGLRNAFVLCAPSITVETPTMIQSVVSGATVYTDRANNKGDVYTSSASDQNTVSGVTVYCDTPKARIFKSINSSFDDGTLLPVDALPTISGGVAEINEGDLVTLTTGQYATFRAYLIDNDGTLLATPSALAKIRYTAA